VGFIKPALTSQYTPVSLRKSHALADCKQHLGPTMVMARMPRKLATIRWWLQRQIRCLFRYTSLPYKTAIPRSVYKTLQNLANWPLVFLCHFLSINWHMNLPQH